MHSLKGNQRWRQERISSKAPYWLYLGVGAESRCCRSQWSSSSSWTHCGSYSRRPGPSSQRATGRTWPSPPSRQSTSRSSSRRRLRLSRRCGWRTAGTRTSDLKHIALFRMVRLFSSQTLSSRHAQVNSLIYKKAEGEKDTTQTVSLTDCYG